MTLILDPIIVNTELAKNYMEKYNFNNWPASGTIWRVNKYPEDFEESDQNKTFVPKPTKSIGSYGIKNLVQKLKENELIFYQLEYLIRKTSKTDFDCYFLLLCQHLESSNDSWIAKNKKQLNILINEETPFCMLGCVAAGKSLDVEINVVTQKKMAPICYLFTNICHQIGWNINLIFINTEDDFFNGINNNPTNCYRRSAVNFGCDGVVTESADIDSALDAFINSSVSAPWRLSRVFIQESVYDEVKSSFAARCSRGASPQGCGDAFTAGGKLFVCDVLNSVEPGDEQPALVTLEPYRTAKELRSLLARPTSAALSVWAADSQAAHEIALTSFASLVSINDYASFHGPPASSLPLYEHFYNISEKYDDDASIALDKRWRQWNKLSKKERTDSVLSVVERLVFAPQGYDSVVDFSNQLLDSPDDSFVSVENGKICFGIARPLESIDCIDVLEKQSVANLIIATINGMAVVYENVDSSTKDLFEMLEKAGAPVVSAEFYKPSGDVAVKRLKVVRSNFGTIFAN